MKHDQAGQQQHSQVKDNRLSVEAMERIDRLFSSAPPHELRENLLEIYHTYLIHVHDTLPMDFDKIAMNMYLLIKCLQGLEAENVSGDYMPLKNSSSVTSKY